MADTEIDLKHLFAKYNIRSFEINLTRLSEKGIKFTKNRKYIQIFLKTIFYLEYKVARENTLLARYNLKECYVKIVRLNAHGKNDFF